MSRLRLASYLARETAWLYVFAVAAFCLLLSIDLLSTLASYLIEHGATLGQVGELLLYRLPYNLHLSLPIATVFAVLLATGRLAKDSELKAAYSLGVPPLSLLWPLLLVGLLVSGLSLINNGYLEPRGAVAYEHLVESFAYERPPPETQYDVSYALETGIYYAGRIRADLDNLELAELSGITVISEDGAVLNAPSGVWNSEERVWKLEQVEVLKPNEAPTVVESLVLPFAIPTEASSSLQSAETLTLSEQWRQLKRAEQTGGETRQLRYQFHRRVADASSAVIFALIAGALGLNVRGRSSGFAWTIVLLVIFYFLWSLSENLFAQQVLSPISAAWFTFAVVGFLGAMVAAVRLR